MHRRVNGTNHQGNIQTVLSVTLVKSDAPAVLPNTPLPDQLLSPWEAM